MFLKVLYWHLSQEIEEYQKTLNESGCRGQYSNRVRHITSQARHSLRQLTRCFFFSLKLGNNSGPST